MQVGERWMVGESVKEWREREGGRECEGGRVCESTASSSASRTGSSVVPPARKGRKMKGG